MGPVVPSEARTSIQGPVKEVHVIGLTEKVTVQSNPASQARTQWPVPLVLGIPLALPASHGTEHG